MRYPPTHKAETIQKIVKSAGALAKKQGFGTTGLDALTQAAGLTTGAFYKHFGSKDELLTAVVEHELQRTHRLFFKDGQPTTALDVARVYLTSQHVDQPEKGCMLPALTPEIARASESTRTVFDEQLRALHAQLSQGTPPDEAWAAMAMSVGAVMLARATNNPATQAELTEACLRILEDKV